MRSDRIKKGINRAPHRSLLKSMGMTDREIEQPFIGVCSAFSEIVPGHIHLRSIVDAVKTGIRLAGGTPMEFATIGICDGLAMGHDGMRYSLPSRDLIADSINLVAMALPFDGLVFVSNCDKITPGMLIAMARINLPSIIISGGPMLAGSHKNQKIDLVTVFEAVAKYKCEIITADDFIAIENNACPGAGSCAGMFTANTMNSLV